MSEGEKREVATMMRLMAEAVELAWARSLSTAPKVAEALRVARGVLGIAGESK